MKILILGGTRFLGKHIAKAALDRGHTVTLFNRGNSPVPEFSEVEQLVGDRLEDLSALDGRDWDSVIDTCGYHRRAVKTAAEKLKGHCDHYTFISSISVYTEPPAEGPTESTPVGTIEDESVEEVTGETYGALKAVCERTLEGILPGKALNVRAGLLVGPDDYTDRFTYWPVRVARGGEVLAPGAPDGPVQFIDVRDISAWVIKSAEDRVTGAFNCTGPAGSALTMAEYLDACRNVTGSDAQIVWVPEEFLLEEKVAPFMEMPLWVPKEMEGMSRTDVSKAVGEGLKTRPLAETIEATLAFAKARGTTELKAGISAEREAELLEKWKSLKK